MLGSFLRSTGTSMFWLPKISRFLPDPFAFSESGGLLEVLIVKTVRLLVEGLLVVLVGVTIDALHGKLFDFLIGLLDRNTES